MRSNYPVVDCLVTGVLFALVSLLFGELLGHALSSAFHGAADAHPLPVLQPVSLVSGITGFGACGLLLSRYTSLPPLTVAPLSLLAAAYHSKFNEYPFTRTEIVSGGWMY
jgi:hypothetical protein